LDPDPVPGVEAAAGIEEGERALGRRGPVETDEAESGRIVDRDVQIVPARLACGAAGAVAGDAVARHGDPAPASSGRDGAAPRATSETRRSRWRRPSAALA